MLIIAIDIGTVNTSVRVEEQITGKTVFHDVFVPEKGWLEKLQPHFSKASYIGIEKQVTMNAAAVKLMKSALWYLLDLKKAGLLLPYCHWGYIIPTKKSPKSKYCSELFGELCGGCTLSKTFHSTTNTKTWAVNVASHILLKRGEESNPIFTSKKKDDLADVVVYCEMIRVYGDEIINDCRSTPVAKLLGKDLESVSEDLECRVRIALL